MEYVQQEMNIYVKGRIADQPPARWRFVDNGRPSLIFIRLETLKGEVHFTSLWMCSGFRLGFPGVGERSYRDSSPGWYVEMISLISLRLPGVSDVLSSHPTTSAVYATVDRRPVVEA